VPISSTSFAAGVVHVLEQNGHENPSLAAEFFSSWLAHRRQNTRMQHEATFGRKRVAWEINLPAAGQLRVPQ
jgi:hypothetical protein